MRTLKSLLYTPLLVGLFSLFGLLMAGCGKSPAQSAPPTERVVNIDSLQTAQKIYAEGEESSFLEYEYVPYSWTDKCDSTFRTGEKLVETGETTFVRQGNSLSWRKVIGVGPNQRVVVQDIPNLPPVSHSGPPADVDESTAPTSDDSSFPDNTFWDLMETLLRVLALAIVALAGWTILRWIYIWGQAFRSNPPSNDRPRPETPPATNEGHAALPILVIRETHENPEPNEVWFKEGDIEVGARGNFGWPIAVTVKKAGTVEREITFGRPEGYESRPRRDHNHPDQGHH